MKIEDMACGAYAAYCTAKDGKGIHDRPLRKWSALLPSTRRAWCAATLKIIRGYIVSPPLELAVVHINAFEPTPENVPVPDIDLAAEQRAVTAERLDAEIGT